MQDSLTKHSSLPANYVSINDLREQWLKKQRPKDEAVVEEEKKEKECLEYEAEDEDEDEEEFPRKYVTINDLREKWLKKQQKKEEEDEEMRKEENFGGNDELGFGVNPNLIEDDGDGNRCVMVNDWTVKKAEIKGKMTGSMRKKLWTERKRILLNNEKAQKRALQTGIEEEKGEERGVVVENEAEIKQIGVSVMHIAVTQDAGKFRRKKRFRGRWNVVQKEKGAQEEEDKEKPFPVTGTRNTVIEKRAQEVEEKEKPFPVTGTWNTGLEKRAQEMEKAKWFTGTGTRNSVQEKRAQGVEEKPKRTEIGKNKRFPVAGTRNTVLEKRAEVDVDVDVDVEEKGEWFPTTETRNTVKEKRVQEAEEKLKRSETGKKKRFPVTRTWNTVQQEKLAHEEDDEKEKLIREMEEKMKEVSILEKQYQEVEQEMKEKKDELSLLEKRFNDIEKMETQASETDHNVSNNAEHGTYQRAMGYRRLEVSGRGRHGWGGGRGRGGGRSGNGHHSERGGVVWVKKDEGLHRTN